MEDIFMINTEASVVYANNETYVKLDGVSDKYWVKLSSSTLTDLEMIELLSSGSSKSTAAPLPQTTTPLPEMAELPTIPTQELPTMESKEADTTPSVEQLTLDTKEAKPKKDSEALPEKLGDFVIPEGEAPKSAVGHKMIDFDKSRLQWLIVSNHTSNRVKEAALKAVTHLCSDDELKILKERMGK